MNASMKTTPASDAGVDHRSGLGGRKRAIGFSHRTCLPAVAARIVHSACRWFGSGM